MLASDMRQVRLRWSGDGLVFEGGPDDGVAITVDSDGAHGQTPTQLLLMSLAGCMAVDVLMILEKGRVQVDSLEVEAVGRRAATIPKRFVEISLVYRVAGPTSDDASKLDRAIALSREKYCSVLHTLDPHLDLDIRIERA